MFQDPAACVLDYLPYEKVAEGYGGRGIAVGGGGGGGEGSGGGDEEKAEDVRGALARAQGMERAGHAVCVNALIGGTNFREGSLSV